MRTHTTTTTLEVLECSCGGVFALTSGFLDQMRATGGTWPCPYCGGIWNRGQRASLQEQIEAQRRRAASAEGKAQRAEGKAQRAEYRRRAAVGQVTKIKRRVANGVCPACNRTFKDLAAHMAGQHPDFVEARHGSGCTGTTGESTAGQQRAPVLRRGGPPPPEQQKRTLQTRQTREDES